MLRDARGVPVAVDVLLRFGDRRRIARAESIRRLLEKLSLLAKKRFHFWNRADAAYERLVELAPKICDAFKKFVRNGDGFSIRG